MNDQEKTREQLIAENEELRRSVAELEASGRSPGGRYCPWESRDSRWQSLVANTSVYILMVDQDHHISFANHTDSGAALHQIVGKPVSVFFRPEHRDMVRECVQRVFETGQPGLYEGPALRLDNQEHWYVAYLGPVFEDGKVVAVSVIAVNVTDRKRAEEELARNKAILQAAIECLPFEFFALGPDGRYILQNAILREHYGDAIGKRPEEYAPDEHTRRLWADNNRRAFAGEKVEGEIEAHIGGAACHYDNVVTPIRDDGEICGILGVNVDITGRKQAEKQLQQANERLEQRVLERTAELTTANERLHAEVAQRQQAEDARRQNQEQYRALVESSPDAVVMVDLQGRIVFASQRAAEQHGAQHPQELVGTPAEFLVVEHERERFRSGSRLLIEQGVRRNDHYTGLRRDGTAFAAELSSAIIRDAAGRPQGLMGVYRDVSERKRAEHALRQTYEELRTIYECMVDGLLIADVETQEFLKANRAIGGMLGYSPEQLVAMSVRDIHPREDLPAVFATFQSQAEGRFIRADVVPMLCRDGSVFYADVTANRMVYNGRPCLIGFFRDVTERRLAEERLKAGQQALRRMLLAGDHERQLITYELHDGVAQQLMGAILHFQSQEPRQDQTSKATDAYREGMTALRQASLEIRSVMSRLRTPVLDMYGLIEAIGDVVSQWRSAPGAPEIEYSPAVKFERLERTLENTLFRIAQEAMSNACRHSKSEKVAVTLTQQGDDVTLEVQDWGLGFDRDAVQENRFGLEGIRERCRILGGELTIRSKPGEGTLVRVKFPVLEATDEA